MDPILELIADTHRLSSIEAEQLRRIAVGAISGNRDRPLFLLALSVIRSGSADLLALVLPRNKTLSREHTALLDFLLTAALEDRGQTTRLIGALDTVRQSVDPVKALTAEFAAIVQAWRRKVVPVARYHNVFTAVRRFLKRNRPQDPFPREGDAPQFWEAEATRELMARYTTALRALVDYAESARLAATWRDVRHLDDAACVNVSTEEAELGNSEDPIALNQLEGALSAMRKAPVKLLLAHEYETLNLLARYADTVRVWPADVLAFLTMGPVQDAVIQSVRSGNVLQEKEELFANARTFQDIQRYHGQLGEAILAALHLIAKNRVLSFETASKRSNPSLKLQKRIVAMERRQSFSALGDQERVEVLEMLIEPVLTLKLMLETYLKAWEKMGPVRAESLDREHRILFQQKLYALYDARAYGQVK